MGHARTTALLAVAFLAGCTSGVAADGHGEEGVAVIGQEPAPDTIDAASPGADGGADSGPLAPNACSGIASAAPKGTDCAPSGPGTLACPDAGDVPVWSYACKVASDESDLQPSSAGVCVVAGSHVAFGSEWTDYSCAAPSCSRFTDGDHLCATDGAGGAHAYACPDPAWTGSGAATPPNGCQPLRADDIPDSSGYGLISSWSTGFASGPTYCCP